MVETFSSPNTHGGDLFGFLTQAHLITFLLSEMKERFASSPEEIETSIRIDYAINALRMKKQLYMLNPDLTIESDREMGKLSGKLDSTPE